MREFGTGCLILNTQHKLIPFAQHGLRGMMAGLRRPVGVIWTVHARHSRSNYKRVEQLQIIMRLGAIPSPSLIIIIRQLIFKSGMRIKQKMIEQKKTAVLKSTTPVTRRDCPPSINLYQTGQPINLNRKAYKNKQAPFLQAVRPEEQSRFRVINLHDQADKENHSSTINTNVGGMTLSVPLTTKASGKSSPAQIFSSHVVPQRQDMPSPVDSIRSNQLKMEGGYDNRQFRTSQGFIPPLTNSRYDTKSIDSQSGIPCNTLRYEDGKVTFGMVKGSSPAPICEQYQQDKKLTTQILNNYQSSVRSSQEVKLTNRIASSTHFDRQLKTSRDKFEYNSVQSHQGPDQTAYVCVNHPTKKGKYRLVDSNKQITTGINRKEPAIQNKKALLRGHFIRPVHIHTQTKSYCSKCAIILLQEGHKVQEINKRPSSAAKRLIRSTTSSSEKLFHFPSANSQMKNSLNHRMLDIRSFEHRLRIICERLEGGLKSVQSQRSASQEQFNQRIASTIEIYNQFIDFLTNMKQQDVDSITRAKDKNLKAHEQRYLTQKNLLEEFEDLKLDISEDKNKYLTMQEADIKQLMDSYGLKIENANSAIDKSKQLSREHEKMENQSLQRLKREKEEKVQKIMNVLHILAKEMNNPDTIPGESFQQDSARSSQYSTNREKLNYLHTANQSLASSAIKQPFRTLFSEDSSRKSPGQSPQQPSRQDEQQQYNNPSQSFFRKHEDHQFSVDLYHSSDNQSPSFQKNERPQQYFQRG